MKASQRLIDAIKKFEGCVLTAYQDTAGVWTIGYGHTQGVKKGDKITAYQAEQFLKVKDQDNFYIEMSQALWGYISDKLGIERSKLSMDTVNEALKEKNVPDDLTQQFIDTLNSCEFARFAPGSAEEKMDDLYQKGIEVITKAEKVL